MPNGFGHVTLHLLEGQNQETGKGVKHLCRTERLTGDGEQRRDFVYVETWPSSTCSSRSRVPTPPTRPAAKNLSWCSECRLWC